MVEAATTIAAAAPGVADALGADALHELVLRAQALAVAAAGQIVSVETVVEATRGGEGARGETGPAGGVHHALRCALAVGFAR